MTEPPSSDDAGDATPARGRRFSDEEFAVILKRASELQVGAGEPAAGGAPVPRGLSLDEIRQIASEAGIDPRFVDQAVSGLPTAHARDENAFVGAPYAWEYHRTIPGRIPPEEVVRVLDALRSVMKQKGEIEDVYGTLEWHHDDSLGPIMVRLSGRGEETRIEVSGRRGGEAGLWYGLLMPIGGLVGGAAVSGVLGISGAEALPVVLAMTGVSWLGTRALWRELSSRWERRLRTVTERVVEAASSVARPGTAGTEDSGDAAPPA